MLGINNLEERHKAIVQLSDETVKLRIDTIVMLLLYDTEVEYSHPQPAQGNVSSIEESNN